MVSTGTFTFLRENDTCLVCTLVTEEPQEVSCCGGLYCKDCLIEHQNSLCPLCRKPLVSSPVTPKRSDSTASSQSSSPTSNGKRSIRRALSAVSKADIEKLIGRKSSGSYSARRDLLVNFKHEYRCPDCREKVPYGQSTLHRETCSGIYVLCPNEECGQAVLRKELDLHLDNCSYESVPCSKCSLRMTRRDLSKHNCPRRSSIGKIVTSCSDNATSSCDNAAAATGDTSPDTMVLCPNDGCNKEMPQRMLSSHSKVCPKEIVQCTYAIAGCTATMTREKLTEHENQFSNEHLQLSLEKMREHAHQLRDRDNQLQKLKSRQQHKEGQIFVVKEFESLKNSQATISSPYFFVPQGGYKMALTIQLADTHMSCSLRLSPGTYDDTLEWPFRGEVTVELLNQLEDKSHHKGIFTVNESTDKRCTERPMEKDNIGWGLSDFIDYSKLKVMTGERKHDYILNDTLRFRISVDVHSKAKPWLVKV